MKLTSTICMLCLVSQTLANKSYSLNKRHKTRKNGVVKKDDNAYERKLLVLPTLLKKFLNGRRKFVNVDGIIGDFLFGMAPSDSPSMAPSDAPSRAPSDSPSESPTAVPSAAPFSWNDVLGSDSSSFKTCPSNAMPINHTTNTELNILYSYKLELEPNAHLFKTLEKVEALLEERLLDDICTTPLDVVSISSKPSDIPGALCGNKTDCYVIAGRFQLLIGVDSIADANNVYCQFLETTRAYIMSGDIMGQIPQVVSIRSTLAPNFCPYQPILSASQGTNDSSRNSSTSAKRVVPIVIGLLAIIVAAATILIYAKYRTTSTDVAIDKSPSSADSDIEFQNSDETDEFEVDPAATVDAAKHDKIASTNSRRISPNKRMPANAHSAERGATHSPSLTEQEIVFTPTSSVATSVLFRSP